uniref:Transposase n=1 Tax=Parastrongyloides trichosuri TaxID=131310 RepID=A0A0N4ZWM3_PARTI
VCAFDGRLNEPATVFPRPAVYRSGHPHRVRASNGRLPPWSAASVRREAVAVRVRLRSLRRRAHEVRRALLPDRDPVHSFRPGNRVPVPVGHRPGHGRARRLLDGHGFPGRADRRLHLRMEKGRAGLGITPRGFFHSTLSETNMAIDGILKQG